VADVGAAVMRKLALMLLAVAVTGVILAGCHSGEITNEQVDAKEKALENIAKQSPDADKIEK
jgi:hypothetical protein